jgi:hypothetical protein
MDSKVCGVSNEEKPLSEFYLRARNKTDGHGNMCRKCNTIYCREYHRKHRSRWKKIAKDNRLEIRRKIEAMNLKCEVCGESHPPCIDFHHRGSDKIACVSKMVSDGTSWQKILDEISKCDVLCSNCHRKVHWDERKSGKWFSKIG